MKRFFNVLATILMMAAMAIIINPNSIEVAGIVNTLKENWPNLMGLIVFTGDVVEYLISLVLPSLRQCFIDFKSWCSSNIAEEQEMVTNIVKVMVVFGIVALIWNTIQEIVDLIKKPHRNRESKTKSRNTKRKTQIPSFGGRSSRGAFTGTDYYDDPDNFDPVGQKFDYWDNISGNYGADDTGSDDDSDNPNGGPSSPVL